MTNRAARALLVAAALVVATSGATTHAQDDAGFGVAFGGPAHLSGGFRVTLEPALTIEISLEQPLATGDGWRLGLVTSLRAHADRLELDAHALGGISATFPVAESTTIQAQLLYRARWALGKPPDAHPELLVAFTTVLQ